MECVNLTREDQEAICAYSALIHRCEVVRKETLALAVRRAAGCPPVLLTAVRAPPVEGA